MKNDRQVFVRYWGGFFNSPRHVSIVVAEFRPMTARGWDCYLVVKQAPDDPSWQKELEDLGVRIVCQPRPRRNFSLACMWRVYDLCRRTGATLFQCENVATSPIIGAWLAGTRARFWWKRAMNPEYEECRKPSFKERIAISVRVTCALATRVVAISGAVRRELIAMGIPEEKIYVRNNPRRLGELAVEFNREKVRQNLGCNADTIAIVSVGRATPVKGWDILVRAFARVARQLSAARLILVGSFKAPNETEFYGNLMTFLKSEGLEERVVFTGHMADIQPAYRAADIFVMPSRSEGCSSAPVEALEARVPCVATRVGHSGEVIQDGVNGFVVERCDVPAMAEALLKLGLSEKLREEFRRNAVIPPTILSMQEHAEQIARDYERLLGVDRPPETSGRTMQPAGK